MSIPLIIGLTAFCTFLGASIFNLHEAKAEKELKKRDNQL
jgi:hypothetical protein